VLLVGRMSSGKHFLLRGLITVGVHKVIKGLIELMDSSFEIKHLFLR